VQHDRSPPALVLQPPRGAFDGDRLAHAVRAPVQEEPRARSIERIKKGGLEGMELAESCGGRDIVARVERVGQISDAEVGEECGEHAQLATTSNRGCCFYTLAILISNILAPFSARYTMQR
jgi:hypothetical protein